MSLTNAQKQQIKSLKQYATPYLSTLVSSNQTTRTFSSEFSQRDWLYGIYQDILNKKVSKNISKEVIFPNSMSFPVNDHGTLTQTRSIDLLLRNSPCVNGKEHFTGSELLHYLGLNNVKDSSNNQAKKNLDKILKLDKEYSGIDLIDIKNTKQFDGTISKIGKVTMNDFCEMINRNYFDGLLNHTKTYRTSPKPILNFKNAIGQWINKPIQTKRISSNIKLARLILIGEAVNDNNIVEQAINYNNQNHVMFRENKQAIFKRIEVLTLTQYLQNLEAQPWFELRPNALEELKVKYLQSTIEI